MKQHRTALALTLVALGSAPQTLATADTPAPTGSSCDAKQLDAPRLLRRMRLDLQNRVPSVEEYAEVEGKADIPDAVIDSILASDEFRKMARGYHEDLLLPNLTVNRFTTVTNLLSRRSLVPGKRETETKETVPLSMSGRARYYRGSIPANEDPFPQCTDNEQISFAPGPNKTPILRAGDLREGYRLVHPYWEADPTKKVRVCAFDAQETLSVNKNGKTIACDSEEGVSQPECGCGPELRFCYAGYRTTDANDKTIETINTTNPVRDAMREQLGRIVDRVTVANDKREPYTQILLAKDLDENGTLAFWRTHLNWLPTTTQSYDVRTRTNVKSPRAFTDSERWQPLPASAERAGVVTSYAYLLRFQTNRGRANRFRIAFLREHFEPPVGEAKDPGCTTSASELDLTKRCTCQYCHNALEPLSAHWGGFAEGGSALIDDKVQYPRKRSDCVISGARKNVSVECRRLYVTDEDQRNAGSLLPLQFASPQNKYESYFESGPERAVKAAITSGAFARATVRNLYERLVKEPLSSGILEQKLLAVFVESKMSFPALVRAIVRTEEYRKP
jgi:hypothetical protein